MRSDPPYPMTAAQGGAGRYSGGSGGSPSGQAAPPARAAGQGPVTYWTRARAAAMGAMCLSATALWVG